jgi:hypothetical protein
MQKTWERHNVNFEILMTTYSVVIGNATCTKETEAFIFISHYYRTTRSSSTVSRLRKAALFYLSEYYLYLY